MPFCDHSRPGHTNNGCGKKKDKNDTPARTWHAALNYCLAILKTVSVCLKTKLSYKQSFYSNANFLMFIQIVFHSEPQKIMRISNLSLHEILALLFKTIKVANGCESTVEDFGIRIKTQTLGGLDPQTP